MVNTSPLAFPIRSNNLPFKGLGLVFKSMELIWVEFLSSFNKWNGLENISENPNHTQSIWKYGRDQKKACLLFIQSKILFRVKFHLVIFMGEETNNFLFKKLTIINSIMTLIEGVIKITLYLKPIIDALIIMKREIFGLTWPQVLKHLKACFSDYLVGLTIWSN